MSLYKRGDTWWVRLKPPQGGKAIRESAGTTDQKQAQEYHDRKQAALWRAGKFDEKPKSQRTWDEAAVRWLEEKKHKRALRSDVDKIRFWTPFLTGLRLEEINSQLIRDILRDHRPGIGPSTHNRYMGQVRAILNIAFKEWEWLDRVPFFKMAPEKDRNVRWLRPEEIPKLIEARRPQHRDPTLFAFVTGLRLKNVAGLKWANVDLEHRVAHFDGDEMKNQFPHGVPLNEIAIDLIKKQEGQHKVYVFSFKGEAVKGLNGHQFYRACKKAGIEKFRWHDTRHTWASLLKQAGASDAELMEAGGWKDSRMLRKYAHLSKDNLQGMAAKLDKILGHKSSTVAQADSASMSQAAD